MYMSLKSTLVSENGIIQSASSPLAGRTGFLYGMYLSPTPPCSTLDKASWVRGISLVTIYEKYREIKRSMYTIWVENIVK